MIIKLFETVAFATGIRTIAGADQQQRVLNYKELKFMTE
jgi:hypothetical protein